MNNQAQGAVRAAVSAPKSSAGPPPRKYTDDELAAVGIWNRRAKLSQEIHKLGERMARLEGEKAGLTAELETLRAKIIKEGRVCPV
jgi:hypothetical protein